MALDQMLQKVNSMEAAMLTWWARRVEDILAGFGEESKKPADLGSIPSESADILYGKPFLSPNPHEPEEVRTWSTSSERRSLRTAL
jgi:hypothetical protein